uniref:Uncharacterized protein n=1 Tax=viral metagenome TaxID=1070528 RepID=A0A6C0D690_9ZZZZ
MPNGNFWVGAGGFNYKRSSGAGARRNFALGVITGIPANVDNKYVPGAGVGASSIANRRARLIRSTSCTGRYPCNRSFARLGLQHNGNANNYAVNWYLNDRLSSPTCLPFTYTLSNIATFDSTHNVWMLKQNLSISICQTLIIPLDNNLVIPNGLTITNNGTITNNEFLIVLGRVINTGTINNNANGYIGNRSVGFIINQGGMINNNGEIQNDGTINNSGGTINNSGGTITGNQPNPTGTIIN